MNVVKIRTAEDGSAPACDSCHRPGMWHLRAGTLFLCEEHRRVLEWHTEEPTKGSSALERGD